MFLTDILYEKRNYNKTAVVSKKCTISYNELYNTCINKANIIHSLSDSRQNIGILLPNSIQYIIAYFTVSITNNSIVPIHPQSKTNEIINTIEYCDIKIIVSDTKTIPHLIKALSKYKYKIRIFDIEKDSVTTINTKSKYINKTANPISNETMVLLHTSGTTSNPKRVMLSQKNLESNVDSIIKSLDFNESDKTLISLPMYLASSHTSQFLVHICIGGTIYIMEDMLLPQNFLYHIEQYSITNCTVVPGFLKMLSDFTRKDRINLPSLKALCFGGAAASKRLIKDTHNTLLSTELIYFYGQTEASPRITHLMPNDLFRKAGSVGLPLSGISIKIVDENEEQVLPGCTGEIVVKGNNVMEGYYNNPLETEKVLKNGWLHTGDLGYIDHEGYLYITGRKKNVIIYNGVNIYPEDIEEVLLSHPCIKEALVYGEISEMEGQLPIAIVVLNNNQTLISENEIIKYCAQDLSNYKIPRKIIFKDKLHKTISGKIQRAM